MSKVEKWVRPCKAYMQRKNVKLICVIHLSGIVTNRVNTSLSRTIHESWTCDLDSIGLGMQIACATIKHS